VRSWELGVVMAESRVSQPLDVDLQWTPWHTFALLIIIAFMALTGLLFPIRARVWTWVVALILLGVFAAVAGQGITGLWRGLLIDERNKISLARLQLTLWTIVVLSGFLTAALSNLAAQQPTPLAISVPSELWLLMGISTTSLVASPLIKSTKRSKEANEEEKGRTFALLAKQMAVEKIDDTVANRGQLVINRHPEDAQWADMFRGEETGNAAHLEKIQMFYFTIVLVLAYAVALGTAFASSDARIGELPAVDSSMVALLGISHAGYLTHKAIPHSEPA
jgi:hypothetical protein